MDNYVWGTIALIGLIYIGYRSLKIQNGISAAQSVISSQTGSNIPNTQEEISTNFMDPSEVTRLINNDTKTFDIPGDYGTRQRNRIGINNNQMATYGTNYSKSWS